jgi:predicted membrane protein
MPDIGRFPVIGRYRPAFHRMGEAPREIHLYDQIRKGPIMSSFDHPEFQERMRQRSERRSHRHRYHAGLGGILFGSAIVLIGVLFLLQNLDIIRVDNAWRLIGPSLLIAFGVSRAIDSYRPGGRLWGALIAAAGVLLLLGNLRIIDPHIWRYIWPLFIIAVGLQMLLRGSIYRRRWPAPESGEGGGKPQPGDGGPVGPSSDRLNEWAFFGAVRRRVDSKQFEGGEVNAMFGGVELDLRDAAITKDEAVIEANATFGGVEIRVPESWNVIVAGQGIFGGYEDKRLRTHSQEARPRVVIVGHAVFGGVSIEN